MLKRIVNQDQGLSRRRFVGGVLAGAVLGTGVFRTVEAGAAMPSLAFEVVVWDTVFGRLTSSFEGSSDDLTVRTTLDVDITLMYLRLFYSSFRAEERWIGGRLVSYTGETDDNGRIERVSGAAKGSGFEITGREGTVQAPADVVVGTFWNRHHLARPLVIDPQKGVLKKQKIHGQEPFRLAVGGSTRIVTRYDIESIINGDVYYDKNDQWYGARFEKRGAVITIERRV